MQTYIALLRGINVGGTGILPMKELVSLLEGLGLAGVRTYIQSGNVVFRGRTGGASELSRKIRSAIGKRKGFEPHVLILTKEELQSAVESNPFRDAESEPKTLHVFFLESAPARPDMKGLEVVKADREEFKLIGAVFYLYAPDRIGRSKLAAAVEKKLGVPTTARNWRTVTKLMSLAEDVD